MARAAKKPEVEEEPPFLKPRHAVDLFGHAKAERTLAAAARSGKLHHAWLLSGPRGIGKATLAYRFTRWLLAGKPEPEAGLFGGDEDASPLHLAPEDPVFHRVAAGAHADHMTITRTPSPSTGKMRGEIVVDDTRRLGPFMHMTAAEGGWRVGIIDAADEMNPNAANSVLKVVEEPPDDAIILLVAHAPGRLLPTIRSRCRRLDLAPLDETSLKAAVHQRLVADEMDVSDVAIEAVLPLAGGSAGRAVNLLEKGGLEHFEALQGVLATLPALDIPSLHSLADKLARPTNVDAFHTTRDLYLWWLAQLIRRSAGATGSTGAPDQIIEKLAPLLPGRNRHEVWERTSMLFEREGRVNLDRKQVILSAVSSLQNALDDG